MKRLALFTFILFLTFFATSFAQEFTAGNMIVVDRQADKVFEFDSAGKLVRAVDVLSSLNAPCAAAFGPNGHLYIASDLADKVVEYNTSFNVIKTIGVGDLNVATGLEFGPNGNLYVGSFLDDKIVIFDRAGAKISDFGAGTGMNGNDDIQFLPDGHVLVANTLTTHLTELDAAGTFVRAITTVSLTESIVVTPAGSLFVTAKSPANILEFDGSLTSTGSFGPPDYVTNGLHAGLNFGPDDRLYIADLGDVKVFTGAKQFVTSIEDPTTTFSNCTDVLFVPYRFQANLNGTLFRNDGTVVPIKEKVIINYAPGTAKFSVELTDNPVVDLATIFNTTAWVFHGTEVLKAAGDKEREFSGTQIGTPGLKSGVGSTTLKITGKRNTNKFFTITKITGDVRFFSAAGQFSGKLTSGKLVK